MMRLALTLILMLVSCEAASPPIREDSPAVYRFEEVRVMTPDSVGLYVRVVGTGPDTVIVGAAAWLARDLLPLAPGRTLIFYDPRSRGGSDYVPEPERLGMDLEVEDIEAVRAHFGIGRVSGSGLVLSGSGGCAIRRSVPRPGSLRRADRSHGPSGRDRRSPGASRIPHVSGGS